MELSSHADDDNIWPEILGTIDKRRKLIESEVKVQVSFHTLVSVEQVTIKIRDKELRREIQGEFIRLMGE